MGFPRQEYWSGLPFPSPGDLPGPGIEPLSPALAGKFFTPEPPGKPLLESAFQYIQYMFAQFLLCLQQALKVSKKNPCSKQTIS